MSAANMETVRAAVDALRASVERETGPNLPLHDALVGQRSDVTFCSRWDRNKAELSRLLDVLDDEFPPPHFEDETESVL